MENVNGGVETKKYIIETTGSGVAIFDYDNDGWPDIFLVNGTTLDEANGKKYETNQPSISQQPCQIRWHRRQSYSSWRRSQVRARSAERLQLYLQ